MRIRLRDMPTAEQLAELYAQPHNHHRYADHVVRAEVSVALASTMNIPRGALIADLSCGNGYIARAVAHKLGGATILGDFAPGYMYTGPIEETIDEMRDRVQRPIDLFVCCETIEHLDNPEAVLLDIRSCSYRLLLSTPIGENKDTSPPNVEHVWGWDSQDIQEMLTTTGWTPVVHNELNLQPAGFMYNYQIWMCE